MEAAIFVGSDMASNIFKEIVDIIVKAQPQGLEILKIVLIGWQCIWEWDFKVYFLKSSNRETICRIFPDNALFVQHYFGPVTFTIFTHGFKSNIVVLNCKLFFWGIHSIVFTKSFKIVNKKFKLLHSRFAVNYCRR